MINSTFHSLLYFFSFADVDVVKQQEVNIEWAAVIIVQDWIWDVLNNGKSKMRPTPYYSPLSSFRVEQAIIHIHSIYQDNNMEPSNKNNKVKQDDKLLN